jgi:hypothetical protein
MAAIKIPPVSGNKSDGRVDVDYYIRYDQEWQKCRETADKFDGILVDLRKYGFTILTGLTTAGSFLALSPTKSIQIGVIVVTMALIVVLYWLDTYYQSLLYGASFRSRFLEIFRLNRGLSVYISAFFGASFSSRVLQLLYFGFLAGLFILGLFAAGVLGSSGITMPINGIVNTLIVLSAAEAFAVGGMITIYEMNEKSTNKVVKAVSDLIKDNWKKRFDPSEVDKLEQQIIDLFEKYL